MNRRRILGCLLCAATASLAGGASAQNAPTAGITRREIKRLDYPGGHEIIQMFLEAPANSTIARHTHPGVESTYVIEGEIQLQVDGQAPATYKPGEGFQVPAGVIHGGRTGASPAKLVAHYIVEKGKPLASPA